MRPVESADPEPVFVQPGGSGARFLIICDHAGRSIPKSLGDLGLPPEAFERHIAWDIGALELARALGRALEGPVIAQRYSRLVIDCNRDPERADSIVEVSDGQLIPGNRQLSPEAAATRRRAVFDPYHAAIASALDARANSDPPPILLSVHSFTPSMHGQDRPWHLGVLHEGGSAYSRAVLARLMAEPDWVVGDNQPYAMDQIDYTIPHHAIGRGLDYLELEVRQDLIADPAGQARIAESVAPILRAALEDL